VVIFPPEKDTAEGGKHEGEISEILEKPVSRADQVSDASSFAYLL
jgi:septum formation protein